MSALKPSNRVLRALATSRDVGAAPALPCSREKLRKLQPYRGAIETLDHTRLGRLCGALNVSKKQTHLKSRLYDAQ